MSNTRGGVARMARIVAMMDDLFFQMKVAETAKHLGLELKVAANGDALLGLLEPLPRLVIVDLNARSQPLVAIERVRAAQKDLKVIGFLSHVQRDLAAQAQTAGCNEVMPRSAFTQNLAAILSAAKD
jgi:DNA-binding NarL/FixJ family response regulator